MRHLDPHRIWLVFRGVEALARSGAWLLAAVFFVRELNMSPLELVLAGTALEVAYFLFEVPTGIVADLVSRRLSLVIGLVIMGGALVATGLAPGVAVVLVAAAVMGFGWTFKSGAEDAWLADEVGLENVARSYQRGAQAARAGSLFGIAGAVALGLLDLRYPIVAGGLVLVALGLALALLMPETGFVGAPREGGTVRSMAQTGAAGTRLIRARPLLLLLVGIAFFGGMWSEGLDRLWEAHLLVDVGLPGLFGLDPLVWFGVIGVAILLLAIAVAQPLVRRLERLRPGGMARVLLALDVASILGTLAFAFAGSFALAIAAFLGTRVVRSLAGPVRSTWLNTSIDDSRIRATVISMTNLGDSAGQWGGGPALGVVGNAFGIRAALAAGAAALSPALVLYARAIAHHGSESQELEQPLPAPTV